MNTVLILIASVAMIWGPTLLAPDDPDAHELPHASPWEKHRHLDLYSH